MNKNPFDKFVNKADSGAKKKERIRQEKKKARAEKNAWFDEKKKREAEIRGHRPPSGKGDNDHPAKERGPVKRNSYPAKGKTHQAPVGKKYQERRPNEPAHFKKRDEKTHRKEGRQPRQQGGPGRTGTFLRKSDNHNSVPANPAGIQVEQKAATALMPLNKFIAWSGLCARRDAAEMVKQGKVLVNGERVTQPAHRVSYKDEVIVNGKKISIQKNLQYILLNKPKDYITTTDDPQGRKTVMDLIKGATQERVFPVGRLDRNTTGVLLLTNDGDLAQRLTHPSYEVSKLYEVKLDKPLTKLHFETLLKGIELEDGFIKPDALAYADSKDKSVIGIEIHSGRNRIVRRMFEQLGYKIKNLDRVMYGNFTKKNIERGKWRFLNEKEIRLLKHMHPRNSMRRLSPKS